MTAPTDRLPQLQRAMREQGVDLVAIGPTDALRWLLGYDGSEADERQTTLLVWCDDAAMILPDFCAGGWTAVAGRPPLLTWSDRGGPGDAVAAALARQPAPAVALVDDEMPFHAFERLRPGLGPQPRPARDLLASLRLRKSAADVAAIARAGELISRAVDLAAAHAAPGMTELELKRELERFLWDEGADAIDCVYVQAGANAADPHHVGDRTPLRAGAPVLVDVVAHVDGRCADIAQVVHLGPPSDDYRAHYDAVSRAQEAGVRAAVVGATSDDVARAATQVILDAGLGAWNGPATGHGIGFSGHEPPRVVEGNRDPLPAGAVITVEPGVYVPGRWGIRVEDTVAVTPDGPVRLTRGARPLMVSAP